MINLIELLTRTLCDVEPETPTDVAYLYAQTVDNQQSVFETASNLIKAGRTRKILVADSEARFGYPGFSTWQQALVDLGVPKIAISGTPTAASPILHTRVEATALIQYVQENKLSSITVVSPPFHLLRAFMTTVTVALQLAPHLRIYSQPGPTLPWGEQAAHSQGTLHLVRHQLIASEIERIETYQQKGDLGAVADVLAYLNQRDKVA